LSDASSANPKDAERREIDDCHPRCITFLAAAMFVPVALRQPQRQSLRFVNLCWFAGSPLNLLGKFFQRMEVYALVYSYRFRIVVVFVVFDGDDLKSLFWSGLFGALPVQVGNIVHVGQSLFVRS
jgi:hypothetical protein